MIQIPLKNGKADKSTPALALTLPEQSRAPKDTVLNDVRKCARWLARLPRANMGEVSRRIFNAIIDFNRIEMAPKTRLRVAELFPREVTYIVENLEQYYIDSGLPLSRKNRKIAILCRELYLELALSYKIIVSELVGRRRRFDRNLLIVSLHRAIHYLGLVHQQSALHYEVPPKGSWEELHRLYAYAWQNQIDRIPVRMRQGEEEVESTIENLYVQTCVLSICDPHRLTNAQLQTVQHLLPAWSESIHLNHDVPLPPDALDSVHYAVDLFSDTAPASLKAFENLVPRHHLALDCNDLVAHLRRRFNELRAERRKSNRYRMQLYRQIIGTLRNAERRFVRTQLHFDLNMVKGLETVFHLLTNSNEAIESEYSSVLSTNHAGSSSLMEPDNFDFDISTPFGEAPDHRENRDNGKAPPDREPVSPFFVCQTANESASGYCLVWPREKAPRIKVGDLLGIQSPTKKRHYSIAAVRWLVNHPGASLQVGIEVISPVCAAVRISTRSINQGPAESALGLLSPEIASASQDNSILLPASFSVGSRIFDAETSDERFAIKLTQLMESTPAYNRYGYQRIANAELQAAEAETSSRFSDSESNDEDDPAAPDSWTLA